MNRKEITKLKDNWDEEFPEYKADENGIRNRNLDQEDPTCQKVTRSAATEKRRSPRR